MRSAIMKTKKPQPDKDGKIRNTCTACRRAKTRCDRGAPRCNRCVRLDIPCIEQLRTQGRPASLVSAATEIAVGVVTVAAPAVPSSTKRKATSSAGGGKSKKPAHKSGSGSGGLPARPMTFMIPLAADAMFARFSMLIKKGKINYKRAEAQLRSWGQRSVRLRKDASYGAVDRICKLMGLDAGDVAEEKGGGLSNQPDAVLGDGPNSLHPGLRGLDDGSAMVACYVQERGRVCVWMNDQFTERLLSADEALKVLKDKQCLPVYLWGCLFTPESQQELYDSMGSLYFSAAGEVGEITHTLTCIGRDGIAFRGLSRVRHLVEPTTRSSSCMVSIIPIPYTSTSCSSSPIKSRVAHDEPKPLSLSACCVLNDSASCSSGDGDGDGDDDSISEHMSSGSSSPGPWPPSSSTPASPLPPILPPSVLPLSPISMPVIAPSAPPPPPPPPPVQPPVPSPPPSYPSITCAPAPCFAPTITFTTSTSQPLLLPPLPPHPTIHHQHQPQMQLQPQELGPPLPYMKREEDSYSGYPEGPPILGPWGRSRSAVEFCTTLSTLPCSSAPAGQVSAGSSAMTAPDPLDIPTHMQSFDWERSDLLPGQGQLQGPPITPTVTVHHMAMPHATTTTTTATTSGTAAQHCHYVPGPPRVVEPAAMGYFM